MRSIHSLALLAALAAPVAVYADDSKQDITEKYTVLNLNETAERKIEQDRLSASLVIDEKALNATEAQATVNKKMEEALKLTKKYPDVKVSTGYYNVWQEANNGVWHGRQSIEMNSGNSKQALELIGQLQKQGLQAQGVNYYLSEEAQKALNDMLTTEALQKLKARADKMATTLGLKVARFAEINPGYNYQPYYRAMPMMAMAKGGMEADAMVAPAADANEQTVSVTINARVYLQ
jgi:predicted secreted protein